jgi:menaquinone-9 beta-reductase
MIDGAPAAPGASDAPSDWGSRPAEPLPGGRFDVAIAGAGPAGGSLALRLARRGMKVALLDAHGFPRDKLCGEYLSPEGAAALERLQLDGDVVGRSHAIRHAQLSTARGSVVETELEGDGRRPGLGISRARLDASIVRQAREAGVAVFERAQVGGPLVRDGCVIGLRGRWFGGAPFELHARATVAANGRHSTLVRQTGSTCHRDGWRTPLVGLKRHLRTPTYSGSPAATVGLHLIDGGYAGLCDVGDGLTNLCALLPAAAMRRHGGDLDRMARERLERNPLLARVCDASQPLGDWKAVAGVRVEVGRPRLPGILYAGDCQGTVDPLAGQGMTMALLDAERLSDWLAGALAGDGSVDAALQYARQRAWHRRFDHRIHLCRVFHQMLIHPRFVDAGASLPRFGSWLLSACYRATREHRA